ncbi:MAG: choice-of-anchor D domain-containing protein [Luteolibacter sp.]|uniref:choice-of-anchor D domain-containing protein n=1 Tax=Luteolibacter sp. TaxID=1962973 RepID=UPI0032665477
MKSRFYPRRLQFAALVTGIVIIAILTWNHNSQEPTGSSPDRQDYRPDVAQAAPPTGFSLQGDPDPYPQADLTGDAADAALRKDGKYESLGAVLVEARHAVEKVDSASPSSRGAEYFAANPGQKLRAWFSNSGLELASGIETPDGEEPWTCRMHLQGVGRAGDVRPLRAAACAGQGRRVDLKYTDSSVSEWFENKNEGLEQGFTLAEPPPGNPGEVTLLLNLEGSLSADSGEDGGFVRLVDANGAAVLHYRNLVAWDAAGRPLDARMEVRGPGALALVVADAGALYPVTVDPMFANVEARLIQTIKNNRMGASLALSGDTVLVGVPGASGAYVFVRSGTTWTQQVRLTTVENDYLGGSVALAGNTALVGPYVFTRTGTAWSQATKLVAENGSTPSGPVALDGTTALVGPSVFVGSGASWSPQGKLIASDGAALTGGVAISADTAILGGVLQGATSAYVFKRSGVTWSPQAKIAPADLMTGDLFGVSVAIAGDTAVIGAPAQSPNNIDYKGTAYIYTRSGTTWSQQKKLDTFSSYGDLFGSSLAIAGNTLVVGAPRDSSGGRISVFTRVGTVWSLSTSLNTPNFSGSDHFGSSVALSGNTIVVGAPDEDTEAGTNAGTVRAYTLSGATWALQAQLSDENNKAAGDESGYSVAISGDTVMVGSVHDIGPSGGGVVYMFGRRGSGWSQQARLFPSAADSGGAFGQTLALSGDAAVVGSPSANLNGGKLFIFSRSGAIWSQQAVFTRSEAGFSTYGGSVAISGDTVIVGDQFGDSQLVADTGRVYVYNRSGTTWSLQDQFSPATAADGDSFGDSVSVSGNTALIGATGTGSSTGRAYVYIRNGTTWSEQKQFSPGAGGYNFGISVVVEGDTALIGSDVVGSAGTNSGSVYVFARDQTTWSLQAKLTPDEATPDANFGWAVALKGNTALIGSIGGRDAAGRNVGLAYVFVRDGLVWNQTLKLSSGVDASSGDQFGRSVAISDTTAVVGARYDETMGADAGNAYTFLIGETPSVVQQPLAQTVVPGKMVTFSVVAKGFGPLRYQWRRNGFLIDGATGASYTIPSAQLLDQGDYDCVVSNIGGVVTSAAAALKVNPLSLFVPKPAGDPPVSQGYLIVDLTPSGVGAWRFTGEYAWRPAGVPVGGLTESDRIIEFMPVGGYIVPAPVTKHLTGSGLPVTVDADYGAKSAGTGTLTVILDAGGSAARWRLFKPGASGEPWLSSGTTLTDLSPGIYYVECEPVEGRLTPPPGPVPVADDTTPPLTVTIPYTVKETAFGAVPELLAYATISRNVDPQLPFGNVGQIRSDDGFSSGFVVKSKKDAEAGGTLSRVVATAAHVVFDDEKETFVSGLQWLLQRDSGEHEPVPLIPRGAHIMDGYAEARSGAEPGVGTEESQNRDAAALFFSEDAGRGGYSGFVASDATPNEFLISSPPNPDTQKMLVGYPVDGDQFVAGRMYASARTAATFSPVRPLNTSFKTYRTTGLSGAGGMSGGPLCVRFEGGNYFPAAIYLGGSNESIVRAIDSEVIELFELAESSSATGGNHTGGGFALYSFSPISGGSSASGAVHVVIDPPEARGDAYWRVNERAYHQSNTEDTLPAGAVSYTLFVTPVAGFETPDPVGQLLVFKGGKKQEIKYTYVKAPEIQVRQAAAVELPDGGSKDFGTVAVGSSSSLTFTIANVGYADLTGLKITKDGAHAADFTVITNPVAPVSGPVGTTTFKVKFTPGATGPRTAVLHIASNDEDEASYDITLTGNYPPPAPEIGVEEPANTPLTDGSSSTAFGSVVVKKTSAKNFTIRNSGPADLTGLKITKNGVNSADFTVAALKVTSLANGATTSFKVTFKPSATGSRKAAIHIASNDADENPFDINLTGKGTAAAVKKGSLAAAVLPLVDPQSSGSPRETITTVTLADGRKYLALTVIRSPGDIYQKPRIEVSGNLLDWFSGAKHTTILADDARRYQARDNTPLAPGIKRYIRLKE